jgi:hypothetical protein
MGDMEHPLSLVGAHGRAPLHRTAPWHPCSPARFTAPLPLSLSFFVPFVAVLSKAQPVALCSVRFSVSLW